MADTPNRYDYDRDQFYYDEESDQIRSFDSDVAFDGDGNPIS